MNSNSRRFNFKDPGMWNNIQQRARQWLYLINFLMITSLYFREYQFHWWHIVLVISFIGLVAIDQLRIFPKEIDYSYKIKGTVPYDQYHKICEIHESIKKPGS